MSRGISNYIIAQFIHLRYKIGDCSVNGAVIGSMCQVRHLVVTSWHTVVVSPMPNAAASSVLKCLLKAQVVHLKLLHNYEILQMRYRFKIMNAVEHSFTLVKEVTIVTSYSLLYVTNLSVQYCSGPPRSRWRAWFARSGWL